MSDSDSDGAQDPWDDRRRMRDDLRNKTNQLADLFVVRAGAGIAASTSHKRRADLSDSEAQSPRPPKRSSIAQPTAVNTPSRTRPKSSAKNKSKGSRA